MREVRADLSLGALVRGEVEATSVSLVWPQLRLVLDSAGRLVAPAGAGRPARWALARFPSRTANWRAGPRRRSHRAAHRPHLKGEARGALGPFRLDGEITTGGERYSVRIQSSAAWGEEGGKLRLIADGRTRAFGIDLDGLLRFAGDVPRFDGKGTLVRRGETSGTEAWRLSAALRASPEAVVAESLDLTMGEDTRPVQLSGSARLSLGRAVGLDAVLNARSSTSTRYDPPRPPQAPTPPRPRGMCGRDDLDLLGPAATGGDLPDRHRGGSTDGGRHGHSRRSCRSHGSAQGWRMGYGGGETAGQTSVRLSGVPARAADGGGFGGDLLFTSDDPATFLRWAAPRAGAGLYRAP